ncbi:MAG: site-specific integrase, partial [Planctomycetes bacterium]|nr:site-specific integrase [Planctomycetota bacterium]
MGVRKKGDNYFIDYWYRGKRHRQKVGPSRRQAESVLNKIKVSIAENRFLDVRKQQKILFKDMAREYIERYSRQNKKSSDKDESILKRLIPLFGNRYLYEITPLMIEDYKARRISDGRLAATVNREIACMKHMFTKAIEWGKANENPVKKVKLFKVNNRRIRFLEKSAIKALLDACSDSLKPIVVVAFNTGMRRSEILNLRWDDVDFVRDIITLRDTKNYEQRHIPMNTEARKALETLRLRCPTDSPYVFCDTQGNRIHKDSLSRAFRLTVKRVGIKDFHLHDCRHTFASHMVMAGVDIVTVKELLGHKSLDMTLRYSHLSPNHKHSAVELLYRDVDTFWTL